MAIIKCPECGHDVSDKAKTCPNCGVDIAGNVIQCQRCYNIYLKEESKCPDCGTMPGQKISTEKSKNTVKQKEKKPVNKKNNITFWLLVLLLSLLLVGVSVYFYIHVKTQTETEAYNNAINSNSPVILQDYLNKYGSYDISHHDSVVAVLNNFFIVDSVWLETCKNGSRESYSDFIDDYPNSDYVIDAKQRLDSIDWITAKTNDDAESYKFYLENNPDGMYVDEAQNLFNLRDSKIISKSDSLMVVKLFNDYYKALSDKDAEILKKCFTLNITSFLSKPNARISDVISYMERLYAKDVNEVSFLILDDWKLTKTQSSNGKKSFNVNFTVDYKFKRTDKKKKAFHSYKVDATVFHGRIQSLDMSANSI